LQLPHSDGLVEAMLRIERTVCGDRTVFRLSGQMDTESVGALEALFGSEEQGRRTILDLKDLTLADREAVRILERFEFGGAKLVNCPLYVREWITRERKTKQGARGTCDTQLIRNSTSAKKQKEQNRGHKRRST
jgi:hypothetical protein